MRRRSSSAGPSGPGDFPDINVDLSVGPALDVGDLERPLRVALHGLAFGWRRCVAGKVDDDADVLLSTAAAQDCPALARGTDLKITGKVLHPAEVIGGKIACRIEAEEAAARHASRLVNGPLACGWG